MGGGGQGPLNSSSVNEHCTATLSQTCTFPRCRGSYITLHYVINKLIWSADCLCPSVYTLLSYLQETVHGQSPLGTHVTNCLNTICELNWQVKLWMQIDRMTQIDRTWIEELKLCIKFWEGNLSLLLTLPLMNAWPKQWRQTEKHTYTQCTLNALLKSYLFA